MIEMFQIGYNRYDPKATKGMFELNNRDKDKLQESDNQELQLRIVEKLFLPLDQLQIGILNSFSF